MLWGVWRKELEYIRDEKKRIKKGKNNQRMEGWISGKPQGFISGSDGKWKWWHKRARRREKSNSHTLAHIYIYMLFMQQQKDQEASSFDAIHMMYHAGICAIGSTGIIPTYASKLCGSPKPNWLGVPAHKAVAFPSVSDLIPPFKPLLLFSLSLFSSGNPCR